MGGSVTEPLGHAPSPEARASGTPSVMRVRMRPMFLSGVKRLDTWALVAALGLGVACNKKAEAPDQANPTPTDPASASDGLSATNSQANDVDGKNTANDADDGEPQLPPDPDALPEKAGLPVAQRAIQMVHDTYRQVDASAAGAGLTVVDLSDDWAPRIFKDHVTPKGRVLKNRYRTIFQGLANDRSDGDGQPLDPGQHNYLELYGIPPSFGVLRQQFLDDAERTCDQDIDHAAMMGVSYIRTWGETTERRKFAAATKRRKKLQATMAKGGYPDLDALAAAVPQARKDVDEEHRWQAERLAFAEVEKRLACEGLLTSTNHKPGRFDTPMRQALLNFQTKHSIMARGSITNGTLEALARSLMENNYLSFERALAERVTAAGNIIEDGSAEGPRGGPSFYRGMDGKRHRVPDLLQDAMDATLSKLGVFEAGDALAFFQRYSAEDFEWMKVVARFPEKPEYYSEHMDLEVEIDRGDVWYDFPYNDQGRKRRQPRRKLPSFNLFVNYRGKRVNIIKWRTTIGGWRTELAANGEEYYRYKMSDVGPRVWRHVVAAPVWIPPESSPLGGMVKAKWSRGGRYYVTNYGETGPGYLSAYGLVAAMHVEPKPRSNGRMSYFDNGIRTHGSSDYMSLRGRFSHGCHRLYNNLAVRLFSFVLGHRNHRVIGSVKLNFRRQFLQKDQVFDMRIPSRGFYYELTPPLPTETLEGNLKGRLDEPVVDYLPVPGTEYEDPRIPPAPGSIASKAGGGEG